MYFISKITLGDLPVCLTHHVGPESLLWLGKGAILNGAPMRCAQYCGTSITGFRGEISLLLVKFWEPKVTLLFSQVWDHLNDRYRGQS